MNSNEDIYLPAYPVLQGDNQLTSVSLYFDSNNIFES